MISFLIWAILGLYVVIYLLGIIHFKIKPTVPKSLTEYLPVSIVIAVRNEEKNLHVLLNSLISQDYPQNLMEVIIGDDQSEDNSLQILRDYAQQFPWIKVVSIKEKVGNLMGKQNVLAQLIPLATHENILITDADIQLSNQWVKIMVAHLKDKAMVSAPTIVEGNELFHHLQSLDWIFSISIIKPFSDWGLPITAVGNNMGFKKSEYLKIGGYENLPFSLTEDYLLFKKMILQNHGQFEWVHIPKVLNISQPTEDWMTFLHQRKRWYEGAKKGPWYALLIFVVHVLINPALLTGFLFFSLPFAWNLWFIKWVMDFIWLVNSCSALNKKHLLRYFLPFQIYFFVISIVLPVYFLTSKKVLWKNRVYEV